MAPKKNVRTASVLGREDAFRSLSAGQILSGYVPAEPVPGPVGRRTVGERSECFFQQVIVPKICRERVMMQIADLSVTADSGWRDVSDSRVAELVDCFVTQGLYGVGILRRPQVVQSLGMVKAASDGNAMLLDGKHTIAALQRVSTMYKAVTAAESESEGVGDDTLHLTSLLVTAITEGVEVDIVEFTDDDCDLRVAYCAAAHDEATNKYKATSIKDLVDVAVRYRNRATGGSWEVAREQLLKVYGPSRRTFVHRMLVAAQTLSPAVLSMLERHGVPNSYIYDNSYFSGHGRDAGKRLSEAWCVAVLSVYGEMSKGIAFSKATFDSEVCSPAKHAERWVKDKRREFGALADSPAFRRVEDYLMSTQARAHVLKCMRLGIRLEGSGPLSTGDAAGIDQCRILCQSLQEAMGRKAPASEEAAVDGSGTGANSEGGGNIADDDASPGSGAMLTGMEAEDTARAAALSKTEDAKSRFLQYASVGELSGYLTRILAPSEKVTFLLDFTTSGGT